MKVEFLGVLAQAQKKAHQTSGIMQGLQIAAGIAQIARAVPQAMEAFDYVDFSVMLKSGFEAGGVSQKAIREEDDVRRIRAARAQAQAQAEQAEAALRQQQLIAQNYNKLNEPVRPGTPLAALAGEEEEL
jgi:carbamoylphosphate synthase large subunit